MAEQYLDNLIKRFPILDACKKDILDAFLLLKECFSKGGKLLICGNGGSCSDSEHIVGELMKGFKNKRSIKDDFSKELESVDSIRGKKLASSLQEGLPCIALSNHQSLNTAFTNDVTDGGLLTFAQQVNVYGNKNDVLLCISTSGNSENVILASVVARAKKMRVISLTGKDGGELKRVSDVSIVAPSNETYMIQEMHLPIYHCLCLMLEREFFDENFSS